MIVAIIAPVLCASAAVVDVSVVNNSFIPDSVTINVNDEVRWVWSPSAGVVPHTTTSNTGGLWDSGIQVQPFSFQPYVHIRRLIPVSLHLHASIGMVGRSQSNREQPINHLPSRPNPPVKRLTPGRTCPVVATGTPPLSYQWRKNGTASLARQTPA
jgi:plastocyanin